MAFAHAQDGNAVTNDQRPTCKSDSSTRRYRGAAGFAIRARRSLARASAIVGASSSLALIAPAPSDHPLFVWNVSPSSPVGLYYVRRSKVAATGQIVIAFAPEPARRLAARRRYVPYDVPLVKRVAAAAGDRVCAAGPDIFIDGKRAARRLRFDLKHRPLPWWEGCRTLQRGEAFLLSRSVPRAFDGRYFAVTKSRQIIGQAVCLWTR